MESNYEYYVYNKDLRIWQHPSSIAGQFDLEPEKKYFKI